MNRYLVWCSIYFILGIIGGTMWMKNLLVPFLLFIGVFSLVPLIFRITYDSKKWLALLVVSALGIISIVESPLVGEPDLIKAGSEIEVKGKLKSHRQKEYYIELVLEDVTLKNNTGIHSIKSNVLIQLNTQSQDYYPKDIIICKGKVLEEPLQMNPSDMDYGMYLKGQGIGMRLKATEVKVISRGKGSLYKLKQQMIEQINKVFKGKDQGIVTAILLGEDEGVNEEVDALYFLLGIGHILALSGFHIGIIAGIMIGLGKRIGLGYYMRYGISIIGVWGYTFFTGAATSTVRASILITLVAIGRCLWEEEDLLTSLGIAAGIILIINPFQLYQVGFQLSFIAVLGIMISQYIISKIEEHYKIKRQTLRILQMGIPCICIAIVINPVLAYHFFETPLIGILFNILVIPVFSILVPCMLVCVGISYMSMGVAQILAHGIVLILNSIQSIGEVLASLPIATLCLGRPNIWEIFIYYGCILSIIFMISNKNNLKRGCILLSCVLCINLTLIGAKDTGVEITQLYVGQGDSTVIITPNQKAILIDGGPKGKGKTIERFLKYKGIPEVTAVFISHPHEDHTRGIIELLEQGISIKYIFIPAGFAIEGESEKLYQACENQGVPIYEVRAGSTISLDQVEMRCVWPSGDGGILDANEDSAVLIVAYKAFKALYTGDIGKETERLIGEKLEDIDLLKVAHHGSKNSTDYRFLLQTRPEYAMISCGINNWYNHPHNETLEVLKEYPIEVLRTDRHGAITLATDGHNNIKIDAHIQEDKK